MMNVKGFNGEWMSFNQDEQPYFPGEVGNDPFLRSKYALSHIWQEWPVRKNDEFCIINEELCVKNEELCIKNEE